MKSVTKYIRISPKKANLVAQMVRRKPVGEALDILKFTPKRAAGILRKSIKSAQENAKNNFKQNIDNLYIEEIQVSEGPSLKRRRPVSRGRSHPILKRTSHIKVYLSSKAPKTDTPKSPAKKEKSPKPATTKKQEKAKSSATA